METIIFNKFAFSFFCINSYLYCFPEKNLCSIKLKRTSNGNN